jgi:hypothetical protein
LNSKYGLLKRKQRLQAAIDFMTSYGIALLALAVTLAILYKIGLTPYNTPNTCTPNPGFACGSFMLAPNGVLNLTLAQATGGSLIVSAIACSSSINATGDKPTYGNIYVTKALKYYPVGPFQQFTFYTGESNSFAMNCYNGAGLAKGTLGNTYTGYIWMNYTTMPQTGNYVQIVAAFTTKYT